jgi:hypothetical protein
LEISRRNLHRGLFGLKDRQVGIEKLIKSGPSPPEIKPTRHEESFIQEKILGDTKVSNLADKGKLLLRVDLLISHQPTSYGSELATKLKIEIEAGDFDFKPAESTIGRPKSLGIHVNQIRGVCFGAVTGKACPKYNTCDFTQGRTETPCDPVLIPLKQKGFVIVELVKE